MDFGAKNNIAQSLNNRGCEVTIYPAHTTAEEILSTNPDGIMLNMDLEIQRNVPILSKRSGNCTNSDTPFLRSA